MAYDSSARLVLSTRPRLSASRPECTGNRPPRQANLPQVFWAHPVLAYPGDRRDRPVKAPTAEVIIPELPQRPWPCVTSGRREPIGTPPRRPWWGSLPLYGLRRATWSSAPRAVAGTEHLLLVAPKRKTPGPLKGARGHKIDLYPSTRVTAIRKCAKDPLRYRGPTRP